MSAEQRKELQEQLDAKERNRKLWPLSYYIAEVPPVDARAEISASVLIELQKRFPDDISDAEIAGNVDAAHHQFVAARLAKQTIVEGGQPGVQPINPEGVRNRTLQAHLHSRERLDSQVETRTNLPEAEPLPPGVMALNERSLARLQIDPGPSMSRAGSAVSGMSDGASTIGAPSVLGHGNSAARAQSIRDFVAGNHNLLRRGGCLLYPSPRPRDATLSRKPSSA